MRDQNTAEGPLGISLTNQCEEILGVEVTESNDFWQLNVKCDAKCILAVAYSRGPPAEDCHLFVHTPAGQITVLNPRIYTWQAHRRNGWRLIRSPLQMELT